MKNMIEIFKTNVTNSKDARRLAKEIQQVFTGCKVNFDLSDCDKIMRLVCDTDDFCVSYFRHWLTTKGCIAEVLPD